MHRKAVRLRFCCLPAAAAITELAREARTLPRVLSGRLCARVVEHIRNVGGLVQVLARILKLTHDCILAKHSTAAATTTTHANNSGWLTNHATTRLRKGKGGY
jgi:hypothetical protein